jgi:hypothetical protein
VSTRELLWSLLGLAIGGMTTWGNVEFWRHRRSRSAPTRNAISAFSPTIDECATRPLIGPESLEVHRPKR